MRLQFRFGDVVLMGRKFRGWTLRDLERESGVSNAYLSQLETGKIKNPGIEVVRSLANAFGCTPGTLLDRCEAAPRTRDTGGRK